MRVLPFHPAFRMSDDTMSPGDLLDALAERYWSVAARHAWRLLDERGRGAIVFTVETEDAQKKTPLRYVTFSGPADEVAGSELALLRQLVDNYEPESEVVLAAQLPDGRTVFDVYARSPAPPEC